VGPSKKNTVQSGGGGKKTRGVCPPPTKPPVSKGFLTGKYKKNNKRKNNHGGTQKTGFKTQRGDPKGPVGGGCNSQKKKVHSKTNAGARCLIVKKSKAQKVGVMFRRTLKKTQKKKWGFVQGDWVPLQKGGVGHENSNTTQGNTIRKKKTQSKCGLGGPTNRRVITHKRGQHVIGSGGKKIEKKNEIMGGLLG